MFLDDPSFGIKTTGKFEMTCYTYLYAFYILTGSFSEDLGFRSYIFVYRLDKTFLRGKHIYIGKELPFLMPSLGALVLKVDN